MTRVHHLDCGTMCPHATAALGLTDRGAGPMVAHCLLIETGGGLVLLDTGFGTGDAADPGRLGPARFLLRPRLAEDGTAVAQVRQLGFDPRDVRHVLITHLDLDHAGGLGDFPEAQVHVHRTELDAARRRRADTKLRYRPGQWAHGPRWVEHDLDGEAWMGFEGVRPIEGLDVDIAMVALAGHSPGHAGFAIDTGDGWLLHAGDAYLRHCEVASPPRCPAGLAVYHRLTSQDASLRRRNADRLADLARGRASTVTVFCSHDATELARLQG